MSVILGGGIAGLSAAHYLTKQAIRPVTVFESQKRIGGWIQTGKHANTGSSYEVGPRTIRPRGPRGRNTLELVEELGLTSKVLPISASHAAAKNRMIYVNGTLCLLPSSLSGLFKTMAPFTKPLYTAGLHDLKTGRSSKRLDDESIYDFAERRFGSELAKYAVGSMICGICAGDAKQISVKFLMDEIFRKEQQYGGVIKGMLMEMFKKEVDEKLNDCQLADRASTEKWSIYGFEGGLQVLPDTLLMQLEKQDNVKINLESACEEITFAESRIDVRVNGSVHQSDYVFSSLPSYRLADLVRRQHPILAKELGDIPYVDVAVVNLEYEGDAFIAQPGFGFLVPPSENLPILGVIFDSCCFEMPGRTALTVMMGGKWFREKFGLAPTDAELLSIATAQIKKILKINVEPIDSRVNVLRNCIPQYVVGHHARVGRIRDYIASHKLPLSLCGAPYDGVGINDVIFSAKKAVETAEIRR